MNKMPRSFLEVFPREIRDQIYVYILASPSGYVTLSPWTLEVAKSLSILRTCKQIQRECKDIIWYHKGLKLREKTQLYRRLKLLSKYRNLRHIRQLKISLELLDRDELQWLAYSLPALRDLCYEGKLSSIKLSATWEKPSNLSEFKEILRLRKEGEPVDGRLYLQHSTLRTTHVNTGWPRFSHWGKQRWLREMLLDPSGIDQLLEEIHGIFGGHLYVDGLLCFKEGTRSCQSVFLDPRNGSIEITPGSRLIPQCERAVSTVNS